MVVYYLFFHSVGLPLQWPWLDIDDMNLNGTMFLDEVDHLQGRLEGGVGTIYWVQYLTYRSLLERKIISL